MNFDLLILSIIQGIGEILPISSSVNLHLFSKLFNISSFSFSLKIALHAGSLITLLIYFRKEIKNIIKSIFSKKIKFKETYLFQLVLGTIPVVILGYFSKDFVKEFNSPKIMGISCIFFGILLFIFDKLSCIKNNSYKTVPLWKSFIIGCFQAIAIFPGVSRLGICLTASRMLNLDRKKAIHFSLMLAIPSITGSLVLELYDSYKANNLNNILSNDNIFGIITTAIIGLIVIWHSIKFMERKGFFAITLYRILIGAIICFT